MVREKERRQSNREIHVHATYFSGKIRNHITHIIKMVRRQNFCVRSGSLQILSLKLSIFNQGLCKANFQTIAIVTNPHNFWQINAMASRNRAQSSVYDATICNFWTGRSLSWILIRERVRGGRIDFSKRANIFNLMWCC